MEVGCELSLLYDRLRIVSLITHIENLVDTTKSGLQTGRSQEIGASIPTNIGDRFELIRDFWNGGADNSLVEGDKERGEEQSRNDDTRFQSARVNDFFVGWRGRLLISVYDMFHISGNLALARKL